MLAKILDWLLELYRSLKPPLDFEVLRFSAERLENKLIDSVLLITGRPPHYYWAELNLTNRSDKAVYIKSIVLIIGDKGLRRKAEWHKTLHLDPHEIVEHVAIFAIEDGEVPVKGDDAQIEVTPSVGKKTIKLAVTPAS